tara:strand:+ start:944 stop:1120 length:177 start_codon:yes stop_codon:yes gene_type:complete
MFVSQGENVHETDPTSSVLANTSIDLDQFIVNDESNLTSALCTSKDVTNDEVDWHASL